MKRSKAIILVAILATLFANNIVLAQQSKSPVCRITGAYDFGGGPVAIGHVITIADPALPTHIVTVQVVKI